MWTKKKGRLERGCDGSSLGVSNMSYEVAFPSRPNKPGLCISERLIISHPDS